MTRTLLGGAGYAIALYVAFLWIPFAIRRSGIVAEDAPQTAETVDTWTIDGPSVPADYVGPSSDFPDRQPLLGTVPAFVRITDERGKPIRSI